jgi:2-polyprenyl-3-methyl-5-hydroxy-6-metoxy-1,4-benzoquinol methylase
MEYRRLVSSFNSMLTTSGYELNAELNVWKKPDYSPIAYSDGDETEQRIIDAIQSAEDLTSLSDELEIHCTDWPSSYHLSKRRGNLVRPFSEKLSLKNVLEIGSGMGAITRALGECGANVLALEGTLRRAYATRLRTKDLPNVIVMADNFNDLDLDLKFDVITLIGVLEYASLYSNSKEPQKDLLQKCFSMLKPEGCLLIAIENKLGIKYFAGAPEDHVGIPMFGLEDRYSTNTAKTFGKHELNELLLLAGFSSVNFHVPVPDYKLTTSVIFEDGLNNPEFDSASIIKDSFILDPQLPATLSFVPELVIQSLDKNNLNLELANSFLVVANKGTSQLESNHSLAFHYTTNRKKEYCKYTEFRSTGEGVRVETVKMAKGNTANPLRHVDLKSSPYVQGKILNEELFAILSQDNWPHNSVRKFYSRYFSYLKNLSSEIKQDLDDLFLPGKYIDLIPRNIVITAQDEWVAFDQEWETNGLVDIRQVIFRSILSISNISILGSDEKGQTHTLETLTYVIFDLLGLNITPKDIDSFLQIEASYQQQVSCKYVALSDMQKGFSGRLGRSRFRPNRNSLEIAEREVAIAERDSAIAERDSAIAERDSAIAERDSAVAERDSAVAERDSISNSTIWAFFAPYRKARDLFWRS